MLVKSQVFGRKQTKSSLKPQLFWISFGPGVLHIWISCPTTSCWCRQVGGPTTNWNDPFDLVLRPIGVVKVIKAKSPGEMWRMERRPGSFGEKGKDLPQSYGCVVCWPMGRRKGVIGKVWTFFLMFFWIGNCWHHVISLSEHDIVIMSYVFFQINLSFLMDHGSPIILGNKNELSRRLVTLKGGFSAREFLHIPLIPV